MGANFDEMATLFDAESEMCLIGSAMIAKSVDVQWSQVLESLDLVRPDDFGNPDNATIYRHVRAMLLAGKPVDPVMIRARLESTGELAEIGGTEYLSRLLDMMPSATHILHYALIVRDYAMRRAVFAAASEIMRRAVAADAANAENRGDALAAEMAIVAAKLTARRPAAALATFGDLALAAVDATAKPARSLPTGFDAIDRATGGGQPGEYWIIGARPSMGKSTLLRQMAIRMGRRGVRVLLVSLEETDRKVGRNVVSAEAMIENHRLRAGNLSPEDYRRAESAAASIRDLPIWFNGTCGGIDDYRSSVANAKARHRIDVVMVDYLQLMQVPHARGRFEKVTEASMGVRAIGRMADVWTIAAAQLSRESAERPDPTPVMTDLRESGQIEQDADFVGLLHRPAYYDEARDAREAQLIRAKMRDGERGDMIRLGCELKYQAFMDYDPVPDFR